MSKAYFLSELYEEAKESLPKGNAYYIIELGAKIEIKRRNYQKAISAINNLIRTRNKDYLYSLLAEIYLLMDEKDEGYKAVIKAISIDPENHKNHFMAAQVYYNLGVLNIHRIIYFPILQIVILKKSHQAIVSTLRQ